jgi:hypothetical protein
MGTGVATIVDLPLLHVCAAAVDLPSLTASASVVYGIGDKITSTEFLHIPRDPYANANVPDQLLHSEMFPEL